MSHNPYFNRWFSAMVVNMNKEEFVSCHNPYFNRWFSAIKGQEKIEKTNIKSQSLF